MCRVGRGQHRDPGQPTTAVVFRIPLGSPACPTAAKRRSPGRGSPSTSQGARKELVAVCHREEGAELKSGSSPVAPASIGRGSVAKSSNPDSRVGPTATW